MRPITRHGLLAAAVLLSGGRVWLRPAVAEVLFKADFETGDFSQFGGFSRGAKPGHAAVVTDVVHTRHKGSRAGSEVVPARPRASRAGRALGDRARHCSLGVSKSIGRRGFRFPFHARIIGTQDC